MLKIFSQSEEILRDMVEITNIHLSMNQPVQIKSSSIELNYFKSYLDQLANENKLDNISLPSLCDLFLNSSEQSCSSMIVNQQVFYIKTYFNYLR